jgi:predicted ATPase
MIESIRFENFRALKDATLNLGPFNVLIGPNGSGKSTVLQALEIAARPDLTHVTAVQTAGQKKGDVRIGFTWRDSDTPAIGFVQWIGGHAGVHLAPNNSGKPQSKSFAHDFVRIRHSIKIYSLDPVQMRSPVALEPRINLESNGQKLAGVLDRMRDESIDNYRKVEEDLREWLPEFDIIGFDTPSTGHRSLKLRQRTSKEFISARDLSDGTLITVALLTVINDPSPPELICLEEPERGLHPRLFRDIRDALYRLSYPEEFGSKRKPVQVLITTHSPYFLDTFKDHPEAVIIAEKKDDGTADFHRVDEEPHFKEIIGDAPLGEVWFTGVLGGVPALK